MSQQLVPGHEQLIWDELESCDIIYQHSTFTSNYYIQYSEMMVPTVSQKVETNIFNIFLRC